MKKGNHASMVVVPHRYSASLPKNLALLAVCEPSTRPRTWDRLMLESLVNVLQLDTVQRASIVAGFVAAGCLVFAWSINDSHRRLPGPPGHWIIGNALDIAREKEWLVHDEWKRRYGTRSRRRYARASCMQAHLYISGPIMAMNIMGNRIVFLNTPEYVNEVLEKRAAITTNRPTFGMALNL
jgi:hypothetical protein